MSKMWVYPKTTKRDTVWSERKGLLPGKKKPDTRHRSFMLASFVYASQLCQLHVASSKQAHTHVYRQCQGGVHSTNTCGFECPSNGLCPRLHISYITAPKLHTSLAVEYFLKCRACKYNDSKYYCYRNFHLHHQNYILKLPLPSQNTALYTQQYLQH